MNLLTSKTFNHTAERYALDFIRDLQLDAKVETKCEWSCLLWMKDYWAMQARKAQVSLQQAKENLNDSPEKRKSIETLFLDSQFLNTVAQVYSKLFDDTEQSCTLKNFQNCPFMNEREDLLNRGLLATTFVTILQRATSFAMLELHPLDSGLLHEDYTDVYGIDLTDFEDLDDSLRDGRFEKLFEAVVKRASELAGLQRRDCSF
jgi:hypothetical protein